MFIQLINFRFNSVAQKTQFIEFEANKVLMSFSHSYLSSHAGP